MKKRVELDVDFIGGGPAPTKEEFLAISEYIKAAKAKNKLRTQRRTLSKNVTQNSLRDNGTNRLPRIGLLIRNWLISSN